MSVSSSICLPGFVQKTSSEQLNFVSKPEMVVHRPESVCPAQELGCYLQGQGHNKGLYDHNNTTNKEDF